MPVRDFRRVAIVNRGEPAMRLINAVREFNQERGTDLRTIALYTEPDRHAMFVREADEAVDLGSVTFRDPADGQVKNRYLDYVALERALQACGAEAAWVGWGFVAEHARFADLCDNLGVTFIGPPGDVIRKLGDKITSKKLAEAARVPVAPWSGGPVADVEVALKWGRELGYPLVIKATAGGGGRGIRKLKSEDELPAAFESAQTEALKAFGDGTLFMEKMVTGARHIEVQLIADHYDTTWALGTRDCSLQRNNQKVVEESGSTALTPEQDAELRRAAARLGSMVGYRNAGTVEFLYDQVSRRFSFMEVNARLQVEHPVTELTTGADLVKMQIAVAMGEALEGEPPSTHGHAVEVRLCAEDPGTGFMPAPGRIERLRVPVGPGVRVDTGFEEGDEISPQFDSMIAKIITYGRHRREALARMGRVLEGSTVIIDGGTSNRGFLMELLRRDDVVRGQVDIGYLDRLVKTQEHVSRRHAEVAVVQAAIDSYEQQVGEEAAAFFDAAARGRPEVSSEVGRSVELGYDGQGYQCLVLKTGPEQYRIDIYGTQVVARNEAPGGDYRRLIINDRRYRVLSVRQGAAYMVEVEGVPHRVLADSGRVVRAPAPSIVVKLAVKVGDTVEVGDQLVVLEAMKTETTLTATFSGTVREVMVRRNEQVGVGAPLIQVDPPAEAAETTTGRIDFGTFAPVKRAFPDPIRQRLQNLARLECLMLGYDIVESDIEEIARETQALQERMEWSEQLTRAENGILRVFVDIASLFDKRPPVEETSDGLRLSAEQSLFNYLAVLDAEALPADFRIRLEQALVHYGVRDTSDNPSLRSALFRMHKAQRRAEALRGPVVGILVGRLQGIEGLAPEKTDDFRAIVQGIIDVSADRYPVVNEIAREVRYRYFGATILGAARRQAHADAGKVLSRLAASPSKEDARALVDALVECPLTLRGFLSGRYEKAPLAVRRAMLEVLTCTYYRTRTLAQLTIAEKDGLLFATTTYPYEGRTVRLITTHTTFDCLPRAAKLLAGLAVETPADEPLVLDIYLRRDGGQGDPEVTHRQIVEVLQSTAFVRPLRRLVVSISSLAPSLERGDVEHYTFRTSEGVLVEEETYRGLHPMVAKGFDLWRLSEFELERQRSADDVYLFKATARTNPQDQRFFALAEVRALDPVRDADGKLIGLRFVEGAMQEAFAAIRWAQSVGDGGRKLFWNRVHLFVRPSVDDLDPEDLRTIIMRLLPDCEGLGLERVMVSIRLRNRRTGALRERVVDILNPDTAGAEVRLRLPPKDPMRPLSVYAQKVVRLRQRGLMHPYELVKMLAPSGQNLQGSLPEGTFTEYDLDDAGETLQPIKRPPGLNRANIVVGTICSYTSKFPEGMTRVLIAGDPSRGMGALAEPECRRIMAALQLAKARGVPVEWYAVSAGAKIAMDSGTENMDWIAAVLRRIVEFTQGGGTIHVVVCGINVGAQPYWNAEATMLMHTKGILIMTTQGSMVLTGKRALDFSGGVSAEDNTGIGGYERIMGPNGQAQFFARDLGEAGRMLMQHYQHTYVLPGERFPRRAETSDPIARHVTDSPHEEGGFKTVGDVFSMTHNPSRKKPFDIRRVMQATIDHDHPPLERWFSMRSGESAVVWDAHVGGYPVCLIGLESRPLSRAGLAPADGPRQWTAGTLFPLSSKKVARSINGASGNRPLVILANLSGFDGSPESMRRLQLEYGAEIGRSVVNFDGPIVFVVISRYHGGAFVVFSNRLNDRMEVAALEGSRASVIGGAPAAAVVFSRDVDQRARTDPRVSAAEKALSQCAASETPRLWAEYNRVLKAVTVEKRGELADEFDAKHSVQRAQAVGSIHTIIAAQRLRPYVVDAIERGMAKCR